MKRPIAVEHLVGLAIGSLFVIIGAACLGYAARGIFYAIAGLIGLVLASGGLKVIRTIIAEMDWRNRP